MVSNRVMSLHSVHMYPTTWQFQLKVWMNIMFEYRRNFDSGGEMKRATRPKYCGHSISFVWNWIRRGRQARDWLETEETPENIEEEVYLVLCWDPHGGSEALCMWMNWRPCHRPTVSSVQTYISNYRMIRKRPRKFWKSGPWL